MRKLCASLLAVAATLAGSEAYAQKWSLIGGETVHSGGNLVYGEFGFPDVSFGIQHGMTDKIDLGFRMGLLYGVEYSPELIQFGMSFKVPIRIQAYRGGKLGVLVHFDPGLKFYTVPQGAPIDVPFGFQFPIGLVIGGQVTPDAEITFGFDLPMTVFVTNGAAFTIAPLFGPGAEYHVDRNLGISLNTRFGPTIGTGNFGGGGGTIVRFGFLVQAGLMYHF
jgi:hypothetical protein